jgi:hypothetical protein
MKKKKKELVLAASAMRFYQTVKGRDAIYRVSGISQTQNFDF